MPYITEERRMIQEQAREFTLNEVLPVANKLDPEKGDIPMDLRDKMAELGYFGILIPEKYGGLGLGCFEYCLVTEELSRGWMSVASLIARGNLLIGSHMMSEEQRGRYLPRMAKGEFLGAFSMSEPNAGSDISNISCRARKDGASWLISGNKYWCTFADGADFMIIIARTSDAPAGKRHLGLSMFFLEKKRGELPPGCNGAPIPKIGYFGWKTYELAFDNCRVPAENMIGEEGQAFYYATSGLETARAHTAARAIGLAQGALDDFDQVRRRPQAVRPLDRRLPGDPLQDRRDGDPDRGGAPAQLFRLRADRHRPALRQGSLDGEAVRLGDGRARVQRGHPDPRRRGLHHPARRRAPLARCASHQDLRGHLGDPEAHHLRPPARPREKLMKVSALTGKHNYFEDFKVGEVLKHARGKTVEPLEQVWITNVTMNTAEGHFNEHLMKSSPWGQRLGFGGVTISMCIGLAAEDTAENALMELGLDKIRLKAPVHHGDTLYCYSEVLEKEDARQPDAGIVRFRHYGVNQDDKHVFEGERIVLIKRRSHWGDR